MTEICALRWLRDRGGSVTFFSMNSLTGIVHGVEVKVGDRHRVATRAFLDVIYDLAKEEEADKCPTNPKA